MTDIVKGMARAICLAIWDHDYTPRDPLHPDARWVQAMKAAKAGAGFLADNVSDEMTSEFWDTFYREGVSTAEAFAAAIRAAAGEAKP